MSTNPNTHYLLAKAQHRETLRRVKRRHTQLYVQACVALESAAMNFMERNPRITCCCIAMGMVSFHVGSEPIGPVIKGGTFLYPQSLARKVEAFENDFVIPFYELFGNTYRPFRIDRNEKGNLTTRRNW